jgi:DNA invertase Pin-like site-specific DNA recombinase
MKLAYSYTRFSSPIQKEGDSARRQLQAAKAWCEENGYVLSDERFLDEGKSGYKGKNLQGDGDLKRFIDLIAAGKVKPGSVLILESFDRFSRLKPSKTVPLFLNIINAGIGMVFTMTFAKRLITEKVIDDESYILYAILGEAQRSHEESKYKSSRVKAAYDKRKFKAKEGDFKSLAWCPPWCDFDPEHGYIVNEDRANIVRRVYDEYLNGNGPFRICRMFNLENIPTLGHRGANQYKNTTQQWYKKTVRDFLFDKRVYGYCEFLTKENYFPLIISKDKYNAVQHRLSLRAVAEPTGGPTEGQGNIFTGICRCSACGGLMTKSSTRKRYKTKVTLYEYLVCDNAHSGKKCSFRGVPYREFEREWLQAIRTDTYFNAMTNQNPNKDIEDRLASMQGEMVTNDRQIEKLKGFVLKDESPSVTLVSELKKFEAKQVQLSKDIQLASAQLRASQTAPILAGDVIVKADELLKTKEGRLKVREFLRSTVDSIVVNAVTKESQINFKSGFQGSMSIFEADEEELEGGGIRVKIAGSKKFRIKVP